MSSYDESIPGGSRDINLGDNDIRDYKAQVRQFLSEEHVAMTDFSTTLTGYHKFNGGSTGSRPAANGNSRRIYINTTKRQIDIENIGTTSFPEGSPAWFDGGIPIFPTGTVLVFFQAAPPAGWTQITTNDNRALRVVGGVGGGTGGSQAFAAGMSASFVSGSNNSSLAHTHTYSGTTGLAVVGAEDQTFGGASNSHRHAYSGTTDSGGPADHTHSTTVSFTPQYIDVICASKD